MIASGDAIVARVAVDLDNIVERWMMGLTIETPAGQRVYGINTHAAGIELKTGAGRHEVEFTLPRVHFAEGDYVVRVGIAEVPGEMMDSQAQAATLQRQLTDAGQRRRGGRHGGRRPVLSASPHDDVADHLVQVGVRVVAASASLPGPRR